MKFRVLGITLGTFDRSFSAGMGGDGTVSFAALAGPVASATTLVNERGVLLQVWGGG